MNIKVLLASSDSIYATRLSDALSQSLIETGDTLEVSLFTDIGRLKGWLSEQEQKKIPKYDILIVDEIMLPDVSNVAPVVFLLVDDSTKDGTVYFNNVECLFKFQRATDIAKKLLLALAKNRKDKGLGDGTVCTFYSPQGGAGTSTLAVSFAKTAATMGVKPLFVSFEHFNGTGLFFKGENESGKGLYDVFYIIAGQGGVTTAIDAAKNKADNIAFLNKFPLWLEVAQLTPDTVETFINAARAAHDTDIVVVDLGNGFTSFTEKVIQCSDEIFVISSSDEVSKYKLNMLMDNETYFIHDYLNKCNLIYNKVITASTNEGFNCKSVTCVPFKGNLSVSATVESIEEHIRGLVNPSWNRRKIMT